MRVDRFDQINEDEAIIYILHSPTKKRDHAVTHPKDRRMRAGPYSN
jgi:hypothetical protein